MSDRIQRAVSVDGTEIAGRVHGNGPALVLLHGAFGSGETSWLSLLPHLTDRFSCYTMSLRGRGLSRPNDDLRQHRLVQDVVAFVESIDEPAGIVGLSGGALLSLGAAERTDAITAVAAYEPPVLEAMSDAFVERFQQVVDRVDALASENRPADAARSFLEFVTNAEELAAAAALDLFEAVAPNVPIQLREFPSFFVDDQQDPSPTRPAELAKITAPVLLLHGTRSNPHPWFLDGVDHVAAHVSNARVRSIDGAGHLGPIFEPHAVAAELIPFLTNVLQPA
jgi:pimeloyl-ACP methyl ester carboxylesterase